MKTRLFYCIIVGLGLSACEKPKAPVSQPPAAQETPLVAAPVQSASVPPPPSSAGAPATQAGATPVVEGDEPGLADLNRAIGAYVMGQLKSPNTLDDLVKAGMIKRLPTAPPGKKYTLDASKTRVIMVDR